MWPLVMYSNYNTYEDVYPIFKQEAAKKDVQILGVLIVV